VSRHLEILRRARLDDGLFDRTPPRAARWRAGSAAASPSSRDQWQQLVHEIFLRREGPATGILGLASATAGEGTTYVTGHAAAELARSTGWRTLLLEANLLRPSQALRHGVEPDPGLRRLLQGETPLEECLRPTGVAELWLLPAGSVREGGSSPDWSLLPPLLDRLRREFRAVLVDLPPVNLSADATIVAAWLDAVVLVVQAALCSREVIRNAVGRLGRANPNVLGSVLNRREFPIPEVIYRRL
jgi:Mrp family chromosome partitioning ATPase